MYTGLLHIHSSLRFIILILLVIVVIVALLGWLNKQSFIQRDYKLATWLMISVHIQFVLGLILYFVSPWVRFIGGAMQDPNIRYWTAEHSTGMINAVGLITAARSSARKAPTDAAKYQRLFICNAIALVISIVTI